MITQHEIAAFQRFAHLDHHLAAQRTVGLVHSRSIDQHDLRRRRLPFALGNVNDALNAVARGLRLGRDDGQLLAHQRIEQRGLARVGAAENADETGAEWHREKASSC